MSSSFKSYIIILKMIPYRSTHLITRPLQGFFSPIVHTQRVKPACSDAIQLCYLYPHPLHTQSFGTATVMIGNRSRVSTLPMIDVLHRHGKELILPLGVLLLVANAIIPTTTTQADASTEVLEHDWDSFMVDSMNPNEDDDATTMETVSNILSSSEEDILNEEDDETTCTICLLNRQGPCRPFWKKVEWCMKHHEKKQDNHDETSTEDNTASSSLGQHCDKYMIPWLNCVQSYRNTYTVLMNKMYQQEFIDPMEASIADKDRVLFDQIQPDSFLDLDEWKQYCAGAHDAQQHSTKDKDDSMSNKDQFLIPASAKVNLVDPETKRPVMIAYIRDQSGNILGYDQFRKEKEALKNHDDHETLLGVASFTFYIDPETTQEIQVFALYETHGGITGEHTASEEDGNNALETEARHDNEPILSTLYYSSRIDLHAM